MYNSPETIIDVSAKKHLKKIIVKIKNEGLVHSLKTNLEKRNKFVIVLCKSGREN